MRCATAGWPLSSQRDCPPIILLTRRDDPRPGRPAVGRIATDLASLLTAEPVPNMLTFLQPAGR